MQLLSAFRCRRGRVCLNRAHFQNHPCLRNLCPAESWLEIGTMYHSLLSLFPADLFGCSLHHLCFVSIIPMDGEVLVKAYCSPAGPRVQVKQQNKNVAQIPSFPPKKTEGEMDKGKNCPAIACTKLHCPTDHSIFFPLKFYLKMSCI